MLFILLKNKTTSEYYNLINKTIYHDNEYYTITKNGKNKPIQINPWIFPIVIPYAVWYTECVNSSAPAIRGSAART